MTFMLPIWLVVIGILIGLATRTIVGGKAYGSVADALFGITGAFAVDWVLRLNHTTRSWVDATVITIWGALAPPLLVHLLTRRNPHVGSRARLCVSRLPVGTDADTVSAESGKQIQSEQENLLGLGA